MSKGLLNIWAKYSKNRFKKSFSSRSYTNLCAAEFPHYNSDPGKQVSKIRDIKGDKHLWYESDLFSFLTSFCVRNAKTNPPYFGNIYNKLSHDKTIFEESPRCKLWWRQNKLVQVRRSAGFNIKSRGKSLPPL